MGFLLQLIAFVVDGEPGRAVALSPRRVVTSGGWPFAVLEDLSGFLAAISSRASTLVVLISTNIARQADLLRQRN
jgi:hypothetical protein